MENISIIQEINMDGDIKLNGLCQCCLTDQGPMKNMLSETYQNLKLVESFQICSGLTLSAMDVVKNICCTCEKNLKLAFDFREQCHTSQRWLRDNCTFVDVVKDEPMSDEEPSILDTAEDIMPKKKRPRGRPRKEDRPVMFAQVFVKTKRSRRILNLPVKTEEEEEVEASTSTAVEKMDVPVEPEEKPRVVTTDNHRPYEDVGKIDPSDSDGDSCPADTAVDVRSPACSSESEDETNLMMDTVDSNDPNVNLPGRYMCFLCDEYLNTFFEYIKHRDNHYTSMNRVENRQINRNCFVCKQDVQGYVKHLSKEHPDFKPHSCVQCNMTTRKQRSLNEHLSTHLEEKLYHCRGCNLSFKTASTLYSHLTTFQHKKGHYQCILCGMCYKKFAELDDHYHEYHKRKQHRHFYPCYLCKRVFSFNKSALDHKCIPLKVPKPRKRKDGTIVPPRPRPLTHKCPQCDQRFGDDDELLCHMITLCVGRFACNVEGCGKMFTSQRSLSNHVIQEHDTVKMCDQCGFSTLKMNKMKWHKKRVHNPNYQKVWENLPCVECGKVLHSKHAFEKHIEIYHSGPRKMFECHHCPTKFRSLASIHNHMVEHMSPELLHHCSFCDKRFVTAAMCEKHMKVHRDQANNGRWKCDQCTKVFNSSSNLNEHKQRVHESKYYECCYCHNTFSARVVLKYHLFEHRGFRPFNCPVCPSNFVRQYLFVPHLKKHGITFDKNIHGYVEKEDLDELLKSCERRGGGMNQRPLDIIRSNKN